MIGKMAMEDMKSQAEQLDSEVGELEDMAFSSAGPKGKFSEKGMNTLVDSANKLVPLFGLKDKFPRVAGDATSFPADLTRLLTMFGEAIDDAIEQDILPEDAKISGEMPKDDTGLSILAGKLTMASKSKPFKKFLQQPTGLTEANEGLMEEEPQSAEEMSSSEMDAMFASRM